MLHRDLDWGGTTEGPCAREPLIDDDTQRVLITGGARFSPDLLRGRVVHRARIGLGRQGRSAMSHGRNAKVREQDLIVLSNEHVFRFYIAMDQFLIVGIL